MIAGYLGSVSFDLKHQSNFNLFSFQNFNFSLTMEGKQTSFVRIISGGNIQTLFYLTKMSINEFRCQVKLMRR